MKVQKIGWTTVQHAAIGHVVVIGTRLSNTTCGMFDVIDVVRSGLSDCTSHIYPSDHTHREP